jgi:hypothetical protein
MTTIGSWRLSQKIAFRFFFIMLGLSTYHCLNLLIERTFGLRDWIPFYKIFSAPFHWLDQHIFYTGYDPAKHSSNPGDNHFGVVYYLTILLISAIGTIIWTALNRKTTDYDKALYWFRLYLRYILGMVLFFYGIIKVIPVQMPYPGIATLLTPLGENDRQYLLWNFMGASPGYMIFTGLCEMTAGLLLFNRRTKVLGYLLSVVVLINVVALNIFYNVSVKMLSIQLLIYSIFLLAPHLKNLSGYFLFGKPSFLSEKFFRFKNIWKQKLFVFALVVIPMSFFGIHALGVYHSYKNFQARRKLEKNYEVNTFIAKDTLPALVSDTLRWNRLLFSTYYRKNWAVILNMKNERDYYDYDIDSIKKTITLHDNPDTLTWHVFHYAYSMQGQYSLTGKWKGQPVQIFMKSVSIDSLKINREIIKWVND